MKRILPIIVLSYVLSTVSMDHDICKKTAAHAYALAATLKGHRDTVWCLAPLYRTHCVSGSMDKTVSQWDLEKETCITNFGGHSDTITSLTTLKSLILSGAGPEDTTIKLWDPRQVPCVHTCAGHTNTVSGLTIIPKTSFILSCSMDGTIKKWDIRFPNKCLETLVDESANKRIMLSVAFDKQDNVLVGSHTDIATFNMDTKEYSSRIKVPQVYNNKVIVDPFNRIIAPFGFEVKMWNQTTYKLEKAFAGHKKQARSIMLDTYGDQLVTGSWDKTIKIWNLSSGTCVQTLKSAAAVMDLVSQQRCIVSAVGSSIEVWG